MIRRYGIDYGDRLSRQVRNAAYAIAATEKIFRDRGRRSEGEPALEARTPMNAARGVPSPSIPEIIDGLKRMGAK